MAIIPEFAISNFARSLDFYTHLLGFELDYARTEEGFAMLKMGDGRLMIDEIGQGRTFDDGHLPMGYPFGKGVNLQVKVNAVAPILKRLNAHDIPLYLPLEEKWYRVADKEHGNRQFVVADPDGYLLRLYESLGARSLQGSDQHSQT